MTLAAFANCNTKPTRHDKASPNPIIAHSGGGEPSMPAGWWSYGLVLLPQSRSNP